MENLSTPKKPWFQEEQLPKPTIVEERKEEQPVEDSQEKMADLLKQLVDLTNTAEYLYEVTKDKELGDTLVDLRMINERLII